MAQPFEYLLKLFDAVGRKNRYGHPTQQTLDTLAKFNIKIFRTDQDGDIEFVSDGKGFKKVKN